jgi:PhnB protein
MAKAKKAAKPAKKAKKVSPIPTNYPRLMAYLMIPGAAQAIDFYTKALGAKERMRMPAPNGMVGHAELEFGDSVLMLADFFPGMGVSSPESLKGTTCSFMLYVKDVDAAYKQAVDAGAKAVQPPTDKFYGDRMGILADPFGHLWNLATHIEDVSPKEMAKRAAVEMAKMGQQPPPTTQNQPA